MGRGPTNENTNMYFQARKKAATYNERLWSREGAAELLGISVSTLADYELGNTKVVPVDKVVLIPVWNGPGTVKLVLVDGNGKPANAKLVQDVYNYIVSPNDRSARLLPTGTAELTCAAATTVAVNYVITGLSYDETTGIEQIKADFTEAVRAVYAQAKTEGVLRYNDVRPLISAIAGVEDFETFTMNAVSYTHLTLPTTERV